MKIDPAEAGRRDTYKTLIGSIVPRPIAFVSTMNQDGLVNAAPFSFFTCVAAYPPLICFSPFGRENQKKDTVRNIEQTGDFVVNIVTESLTDPMNICSADFPPEVSEIDVSGLTLLPSEKIKTPRIAESPINLECRKFQILEFSQGAYYLVIGEVVLFHLSEGILTNGEIDIEKLKPLGRLNWDLYVRVTETFEMKRPKYDPDQKTIFIHDRFKAG